jgi:hypothetical protein
MPIVRFLVRKEDNPKFLKYFEAPEIFVLIMVIVLPLPIALIFRLPLWLIPVSTLFPFLAFVGFFRFNKPKSYFKHWVSFHLRYHFLRYSSTYEDYPVSTTQRIIMAESVDRGAKKGDLKRWKGPGIEPRWPAKVLDDRAKLFVREVETAQKVVLQGRGTAGRSDGNR